MSIRMSPAALLAVAALAAASSAQVVSREVQGRSEILARDGRVVRATPADVRELREFDLPGSPGYAAAWTEVTASEGEVPYYAISLDGREIATVRGTSYELSMRRASFDPLRGAPSFGASRFDFPDTGAGGEIYFVQYFTQPLIEYSRAIERAGGRVYDALANHAHLVRLDPQARARVEALPFVRWIGAYHPEFRVDPEILAALQDGSLAEDARYNVQVFERGLAQQDVVAARVRELGGTVHLTVAPGFRMEATLSPEALISVAAMDEVRFIDAWGPPSEDMDNAREISGANYVDATPGDYRGQGVRAEVLDGGCDVGHPDFTGELSHGSVPVGSHGTCTAGIVFGTGAGDGQARGVMSAGTLIAAYYNSFSGGNRYAHTAELVNPSLAYKCVLQSNSWGGSWTTSYTTVSGEMDDIIADADILILQSQSNNGTTSSRPEAWAKNIVSIGGVRHYDTLSKSDDQWNGASIGPAADGRLKPDLSHFYDYVYTTDVQGGGGYTGGNYYSSFSGTSSATPISAGHCGLFYQMWKDGIFGNTTGGGTVFDERPHFTLAKAAMINTASQYPFTGTAHNLTRTHQGWGLADVKQLYDMRAKTFFVDETDSVTNLGSVSYSVNVQAGEPALRATLVYADAMGAVSSSQHRKNDLTLVVTSPGGTIYYGNNGLAAGVWSTSGGSPNTKDTVENVFVQNPAAGTWTVQVRGDDVNTDPSTNTPTNVTEFALWVTGVTPGPVCPTPITYCTAKLTSSFQLPAIGWTGTPSVAANAFTITLTNAEPQKNGLVFFGSQPHAGNFQDGTLCALPPLTRTPLTQTDANGAASHALDLDLSMVGLTLYYQWWFRDPLNSFGTGLSDGLEVTYCD